MVRLTDIDRDALRAIGVAGCPQPARDVAEALGWNARTGGSRLTRLVRLGLLEPRHDGYGLTDTGSAALRNLPPIETVEPLLDDQELAAALKQAAREAWEAAGSDAYRGRGLGEWWEDRARRLFDDLECPTR